MENTGTLTMTQQERDRLLTFGRVKARQMTLVQAAKELGLSYRQVRRLFKRYQQDGDRGLIHGLRGKPSNNQTPPGSKRDKAIALYREQFHELKFGPTLASQRMASHHNLQVNPETLRLWLMAEDLWKPRTDKSRHHRSWRERKPWFGQLVQFDGSDHAWFGENYPRCCLMVMIDDATSRTLARFFESETTLAAMQIFYDWANLYGLPWQLYPDRHSIHRVNDQGADEIENCTGNRPLTRFGQSMDDLKVKMIYAKSPQAKGRVERSNGTFQDRLVKLMQVDKVVGIEQGNEYLQSGYLADHNKRFSSDLSGYLDVHRSLPTDADLKTALCEKDERSVGKDGCVRFENQWFQLLGKDNVPRRLREKVEVRKHLDGRIEIWGLNRSLEYKELTQRG